MKHPYGIGLDIGIASVGWAVVALNENSEPYGLIRCGSRIFDKAEQPKTGESLAAPRREARSTRRRLRRRSLRKADLYELMAQNGLPGRAKIEEAVQAGHLPDIYALRVQALDGPVTSMDFARILLHLMQRRGFRSNRKADDAQKDGKALTSYPNAFKALRVIDGRSFIKMDDEESFALAALIRRRTNSSKTIAFENQIHRIVYEKVSKENQYFLTAKSILQTYPIVNKDGICSEQMVEAAAIERLSKENRFIKDTDCLQRWDYVCHQVSASPFKPIKYMEWIDIFGYRKSAWDEEIGIPVPFSIDKYLVVEIKKDYLREKDAAAVTQVMKYVDWVTRKYANNIYPMVTAYIIANGFDEDFKRSCRETGIRNYNLGYRNSQPQTWMDIKLIKYSFDGQEISFVEVPNV